MDNIDGRRWARTFLGIALAVSLIGNVAHTILADSTISLWLRVPGAVIWPIFAFGGIEILVRMRWLKKITHHFARFMVLTPVIPAAIISFEHLHSMLLMMGERKFIAGIGPIVIDGMMLGCTLVLLFTRPALTVEQETPDLDEVLERYGIGQEDWSTEELTEVGESESLPIPVSPAPARAPRASWDARKVAEMAVDGARTQEIVDATSAGRSTVDRFRKVAKMLVANPRAEIDFKAEKLSAEHVTILRELVTR